MGARLAGAALGFAGQAMAARMLGPDEFGRYGVMLVWLLLLGHAASAGTSQLVYRNLAVYRVAGSRDLALGLLRMAGAMVSITSLVLAGGGILALHLMLSGIDSRYLVLGTMALGAVPLLATQDLLEAIARGLDRPVLGIGPAFLLRHLALLAGLGALGLIGAGADEVTVLGLTIGGLAMSIVVQAWLVLPHVLPLLRGARPLYHRAPWLRTALPIALVEAAEVLFQNMDMVVLAIFVPAGDVALYFAATRLVQVLGYVPYATSAVTAQTYAVLGEAGDRLSLQRLIGRATLAVTSLVGLGAVSLSLAGGPLLGLFGAEFRAASGLLPVLCAGLVIASALGPGEDVLAMLGQERTCARIYMAALAAGLMAHLVLIPAHGATGAAIAMAFALSLRGLLMAFVAYRRLGLVLPIGGGLLMAPPVRGVASSGTVATEIVPGEQR
ncbi:MULTISPECIES: lipopolysaccharide biosynthesis protein [unclassified Chelatococcus]|uniref:lipopolysaccharide biosynthesis protein n=1 Tax=unclassified Chelatococcus TaxID=2638111 RepID=UPI001BD1A4CE|nr:MULTISPECIES: lipopolysaccharide biosynthesis protein [unclassified Chelatococcus]CAH1669484.1 Polysacc_synt_C domain-containing protein [Hyphomicrobiales bacterium]MBS7738212.1 lipopolysaccharide biosynthesis protein [Chelatococcus sp. HY11]MBX3545740.1 lipopolysaccharide biosynthesis protein [Chelatococcus sp.]MCO5077442.1 lipopolysaccharide biosynthesis protein [Chelatococcus sp.]CAH1678303.1 Polysacc_synt_C domain-containing protein [Hyphomicrobiales bacterium]